LTWAAGGAPPVWVAGYGPKTLTAAGRFADGIVLQFGDPHLAKWCLGFVREGAAQARRDWTRISIMAAALVWVADDLAVARERVRWFPALFSNQVVDLLAHYSREPLPAELSAYVGARTGYGYRPHGEAGSANAEVVADEIVDRYCLWGRFGVSTRVCCPRLSDAFATSN
jgi:alkanesulfonate monooxygenase SsuD/methylene tetrahydromethanopterin reductase-like flavin-dependent oxidoreductase (luciferase family)